MFNDITQYYEFDSLKGTSVGVYGDYMDEYIRRNGIEMKGSETPSTTLKLNDPYVREFIKFGLNNSDENFHALTFQFMSYLDTIDFEIFNGYLSPSIVTQSYYSKLATTKDLKIKYGDNLKARLELDLSIIKLFSNEYVTLFSEGSCGFCGWEAGGGGGHTTETKFQWPPPAATDRTLVDIGKLKSEGKKLDDVYKNLIKQLEKQGIEKSCTRVYKANDGFALITRLEQTNENGIPLASKSRWSKEIATGSGWGDYWTNLLAGKTGYYRSLIFIVNKDANFKDNGSSYADAKNMESKIYNNGNFELSNDIKNLKSSEYSMTVLIYRFEKKNGGIIRAIGKNENEIPAETYLKPLGILNAFK